MPNFQDSTIGTVDSENRARARKPELNQKQADALAAWTDKHAKEMSND
jgi:hypothetical protein